jgi:hypothetical protein
MIVDKCIFCGTALVMVGPKMMGYSADCPNKDKAHPNKTMWNCYYDPINVDRITHVNIIFSGYQFHFDYTNNTTELIEYGKDKICGTIAILNSILDAEPTEKSLLEKAQTIQIYM